MARLLKKYKEEVVPALMRDGQYKNVMAVPKIEKIVVSMGIGKATENRNRIAAAVKDLSLITGQKPLITRARKSVAGFKLRKGTEIGCKVTLRGVRMYEFLDKLISIVIPRIRDFRGLPRNAFDQRGNYNLGIVEQFVFPEVSVERVEFTQGMNIAIVVRSKGKEESLRMLEMLGMPFRRA
jgi:large subunit ribosomal protein L5